jgi:polysaccharide export outer membrane protein
LLSTSRGGGFLKAGAALLVGSLLACASVGEHVWVDDYRDPQQTSEPSGYVLAAGDTIQVRIFLQDGMSARTKVRSDGKITLPFLNDVQAAGYEPAALAQQLTVRLRDFVNNPVVTISVEEQRQMPILVVGEVTRQGIATMVPGAGVLEALVVAGGLTPFAHPDRIFVVRPGPSPARIRFSYPSLLRGKGLAGSFRLKPGDQLVVE